MFLFHQLNPGLCRLIIIIIIILVIIIIITNVKYYFEGWNNHNSQHMSAYPTHYNV